jgi:hypothetical protein
MAARRENVVRVLLYVADDLEDRRYPMAGVLRQLAREVAVLAVDEPVEGRCGCGAVIVQPRTGRPRKYCTTCSPVRKTPAKAKDQQNSPTSERGAA